MQEVFDFVECADPAHQVLWNIESKIDARFPNLTLSVDDFVQKQHAVFERSPYKKAITVCINWVSNVRHCSNPWYFSTRVSIGGR